MAASNFAQPQFQAQAPRQVQAPVVQQPSQSGGGLKGVLTGLAKLAMGVATDDPALMASGASGAVLGPKAGNLAGTLAGAASTSAPTTQQQQPDQSVKSGGKAAWNSAAPAPEATPVDIPNNPATQSSGATAPSANNSTSGSSTNNQQSSAGGLDPSTMMFLLQAFGLLPNGPKPPQSGQGWGP